MYIRSDLACNPRHDLTVEELENIWVEILLPKTKPILVCVCYRPPRQTDFYTILENSLMDVHLHYEIIILGDFNTNVKNIDKKCTLIDGMRSFMNLFGMTQLINCATRITLTSSSIIDLIFVSESANISQSGVLPIGFSDHQVIYCTRKLFRCKVGTHKSIKLRSCKHYDRTVFNNMLSDIDWNCVYSSKHVDEAWQYFTTHFCSILNRVAPLKEVRVKQRTEPWFDSEIHDLIQQRDCSLKLFRNKKSSEEYEKYVALRNKVNYKIKDAKANYYKANVMENKNNPKKLWSFLKELGANKKCLTKVTNFGLMIKDKITFAKLAVATHFNHFFSNIADKLVNKLPPAKGIYGKQFVKSFYKTNSILSLKLVTTDKVLKLLTELNSQKATGLDGLPAKFLKDGASTIAKPLSHIINMSITSGQIPKELKCAKIVPIYKKKLKTDPGNYRPVSILSIISKIFEKVVCEQLSDYLECNNLMYDLQSGFRQNFSTDSCLIHLSDYILNNQDKGEYTGIVVIDLQKAFDTVNHKILLSKLQALGLDQVAIKWFASYLEDRQQIVQIGDTHSDSCSIKCGVPQRSILGPLLFLIYVNDMRAAVSCRLLLYADDSALLTSGKDVSEIEGVLSRELESLSEWLEENRLSLHLGKTQSILFGSKKRLRTSNKLHVVCNGSDIEPDVEVTYLGVNLDQSLSGSSIVNKIVTKCNNKIKFLYRNARSFDPQTKGMLASALVQCHFDYACSMWFSCVSSTSRKRLQIIQNKLIRFILGISTRSHIGYREFSSSKMLPVEYRVTQLKLNHMFNIVHGSAPEYLKNNINITREPAHNTRSGSFACYIPNVKSFGIKSFFFTGSKLWNSLSHSIQCVTDKFIFKKMIKGTLWNRLRSAHISEYIYY